MGLFRRKTPGGVVEQAVPAPEPEHRDPVQRAAVHAGVPGRCPQCDGFGYIDHIDLKHRFQTQHCLTCRHSWEFSFDGDGEVIDLTDSAVERSARSAESAPG